jgi:adenosylcobinamide-GDP ribazoletransferase
MVQEWRYFLTAICFFTRIPVSLPDFQESDLNHSTRYFPLVGVLVGVVSAGVYYLAHRVLPQDVSVLLSMLTSLLMTGAFHEDGLADAVDGLGGGYTKERVLEIMQDSRIGSFGATALVMALLAKFTVLTHIDAVSLPLVMIAGHSVSRMMAVLVIYRQSYVREGGKAKPLATKLTKGELLLAALFGFGILYFFELAQLKALALVILVWFWFSRLIQKRIGGYTGDCLGAMQQLTEIAFYVGILAVATPS